jgi:proline dehydrogenase
MSVVRATRRWLSTIVMPLAEKASRAYVAGSTLEDALAICPALAQEGIGSTIGYWDGPNDQPRQVADIYLAIVEAIAARQLDRYISIKLPAIGASDELLDEVLDRAAAHSVRVHFDSLTPESADQKWATIRRAISGPCPISGTLPSRWRRSIVDAETAIELGLPVRVVKGQWTDPEAPQLDPREGYLDVIDRLAGRAKHVAVASHDVPLAEEALKRLRGSGTPCGLELLYGLPSHAAMQMAHRLGVEVRVYVPYGQSFLPYCLSQAMRNPRILWWLFKDSLASSARRTTHEDRLSHQPVSAHAAYVYSPRDRGA